MSGCAKRELVHVVMQIVLARFVIDAMQIALKDGPHALVMYDASTNGIARSSKLLFGALSYWPMTGCGPSLSLSRRINWKFLQATS